MSFVDLGLSAPILKAIEECGYTEPTPIQLQAIPQILMARDLVGLAQTGTGKTAGFTLPMIEMLSGGRARARMPRSLILSPTRELAAQIAQNFDTYGKYSKLSKALLVGGSSMDEQIRILERGVDVLIATPGRLIDLFERGNILLNDIKILVIDEADRMLDMGFIPDIEKICTKLPPLRQTLLFSATMPPEIQKLTKKFLQNPREISVTPQSSAAETVEQFLVKVSPRGKQKALEEIIRREKIQNAFIFCNRKRDVDLLDKHLRSRGYDSRALHGDMAQSARTETLRKFKAGEIPLLVCSDVAARGIDVQGVSHVVNYDVPFNAEDYIHRIGRTGRAGLKGRAWMLATDDEDKALDGVQKLIKKNIEVVELGGGSRGEPSEGRETPGPRSTHRDSKPREGYRERDRDRDRGPRREDRSERSERQKPETRSSRSPREREPREEPSKGFGDDLPAFLRR